MTIRRAQHARLILLRQKERRDRLWLPSPLAGEGNSESATERMGEGSRCPSPFEFAAIWSQPSPTKGEGTATTVGVHCTVYDAAELSSGKASISTARSRGAA